MNISKITTKDIKAGKLKKELPEFYELQNVIENNLWHNNESTFDHSLKVLTNYNRYLDKAVGKIKRYLNSKIDKNKIQDLISLSILLHDLGKKETIVKAGNISSFPLHEKMSVVKSKKIISRFGLSKAEEKYVLEIIKDHSYLHSIVEVGNGKLEDQFIKLASKKPQYIIGLIILVMTDGLGGHLKNTKPEEYKFRVDFYRNKLKLFNLS